jgi:hypothetical protein
MTDERDPSLEVGFNVLLEGQSGAGKTHSLGTLVDTGLEVHTIFLEAGQETLLGYYTDKGLPIPPNLHIHNLKSRTASFKDLLDSAKKVNTLPHDALCKMTDPYRSRYDAFFHLLNALNDYTDQRTGESFGGVDTWGIDRVIAIDGLSGINRMAMQLVTGGRPSWSVSDYGQAQFFIEELLKRLCNDCRCNFVLIGHIEREVDLIQGGTFSTVSTLGKALAPKIPQLFSDVILAKREGSKYMWSTADSGVILKHRNLPLSATINPDFGPIVEKWRSRIQGV